MYESTQQIEKVIVAAVLGPAGGGRADFRVLNITIGAVRKQELNHRTMAVERCVVQACGGIVETAGNHVDLSAFFQQQFGGVDVAVHASKNEGVIDDALPVLRPGVDVVDQRLLH